MNDRIYDAILIGGSGFIGSALATLLAERGESVLSISRNPSDLLPQGVEELVADIKELENFPKAKAVFILLGQNSNDFNIEEELTLLEKLVENCNRIQPEKVLYLSSVLAYGERQAPASEGEALVPLDPYSEYKAKAESLLKEQIAAPTHLGILRLANVYGSPKNRGFIGFLMKQLATPQPEKIIVNGDGSQERDYIFLDDVVHALLAVRDGLHENDIVNIASGQSHTLLELIQTVGQVAHKELPYEVGGEAGTEVNSSRIQNDKLREQYGFVPQYSLAEGLKKTIERYQIPTEKILLLGGEGFIGRNLASHFCSQFSCVSVGEKESIFPDRKAEFIQVNPYEQKVEGNYSTIIHLIDHKVPLANFVEEEKKLVANIPFTEKTQLVLFSSAVVYANPDSEYGQRKKALEEFYTEYCKKQGVTLTIFRPFNVFGPFQMPYRQGSLVANLIHNALMNRPTDINDMEAKRDFVYVGDIVRSVERVLASPQAGVFDIGSGQLTSVRDLINHLETILGQSIEVIDKETPENLNSQSVADHSWDPQNMVNLGEGLAQTVPFYRLYRALVESHREQF
jgi:UDP-glucose 4-epimerase